VVRLLLQKGADIEAKDKLGQTALFNTAMSGLEAAVLLLLGKGADIEAKDKNRDTVLI
jgi:ankyrin repeat protein